MTQQDTINLRAEINFMIDKIGFNFNRIEWISKLSEASKLTLDEYMFDAKVLSRRDIVGMLYNNEDEKLWSIILNNKEISNNIKEKYWE